MKRLLLFLLLFTAQLSAKDLTQDTVSTFIQAAKVSDQHTWVNYQLQKHPTILVFPNGLIYAIHFTPQSKEWTAETIEGTPVWKANQDKWNLRQMGMVSNFPIEGQNGFIFPVQEEDPEKTIRIVVHEQFHDYQARYFADQDVGIPPEEAYTHPEVLALIVIEDQILRAYADQGLKSSELLQDYLVVNDARLAKQGPVVRRWEAQQQRMEGLAEYVSQCCFNRMGSPMRNELVYSLGASINEPELHTHALFGRHYGIGAILAHALDALQVANWKQQVQEGRPLVDLVRASLSKPDGDRLAAIKTRYHYNHLIEQAKQNIERQQAEADELNKRFRDIEGVVLSVELPPDTGCSGSGMSMKSVVLKDGTKLIVGDQSISTTPDQKWRIQLDQIPIHYLTSTGGRILKVPPRMVLTIDGKPVAVQELFNAKQERGFTTLSWKEQHSEFHSEGLSGKISFENDALNIRFFF